MEILSYIKDTSDFLRKINAVEFVPDNSYLLSLDVKSLYTSNPNVEGIKAVKMSLEGQPSKANSGNKSNQNIFRPHSNIEELIVYIKNSKLYTKIYRKKTDCETSLNINSKHPKSLETSIMYSQVLKIKRICSKLTDFEYHLQELKERLARNELLKEKTHDKETQNKTSAALFESTGIYLILAERFKDYSKNNR